MADGRSLIYQATAVTDLIKVRTSPPMLHVRVEGVTRPSGWRDLALVPRNYGAPPADRMQEFEFVASPPLQRVLEVETPVSVDTTLEVLPDWVRGVRVLSKTNVLEQMFPVELARPLAQEHQRDTAGPALVSCGNESTEVEALLVDEEEGFYYAQPEPGACREFLLVRSNHEEFKTEETVRCIARDPMTGRCLLKSKVPVTYRREAIRRLLARVCFPNSAQPWTEVENSIRLAVSAGVGVNTLTEGNLSGSADALRSSIQSTLAEQEVPTQGALTVDMRREKIVGPWQRS